VLKLELSPLRSGSLIKIDLFAIDIGTHKRENQIRRLIGVLSSSPSTQNDIYSTKDMEQKQKLKRAER
jgi:hypothetical protein